MKHLKRHVVPKNWPVPRKGTTFVITPNLGKSHGLPLLIVLREMLGIVKTRKEAKKAINEKNILINRRVARDEKEGIQLFDKITIVPSKKNYKIGFSTSGKFNVEEIEESGAENKIAKVINKKIMKGKKTQLNLSDGRNFISDLKCKVNDSVKISFKDKKITKCLPLQEKANVVIIAGKHMGKTGKIVKIIPERKMAEIDAHERITILIKQIMVIE